MTSGEPGGTRTSINDVSARNEAQEIYDLVEVDQMPGSTRDLPDTVLPVPIVLFRSQDGRSAGEDLDANESWGWTRFTTQAVSVEAVLGDHICVQILPCIQTLAEHLHARPLIMASRQNEE